MFRVVRSSYTVAAVAFAIHSGIFSAQAACTACNTFGQGVSWGMVSGNPLAEASGIAASRRNPGVLYTHNDGSAGDVFALSTNAARLATFEPNESLVDLEDIAVGPGPVGGLSYLYLGDIGGNTGSSSGRSSVKIVRLPEPLVDLAWANNPHAATFQGAETFTLFYPDGSYDAESLMVDPISGDVFIATKQSAVARIYRANLTTLANESTVTMEFVRAVSFGLAAGGDISADGTQIILRREDFAMSWGRCTNETVGAALGQAGQSIPIIDPPLEPNGEAIGLLPDGTGYVTISEGEDPIIYFFQAQCPSSPRFNVSPVNESVFVGGQAEFRALAVGYPTPTYQWRFNSQELVGQTNPVLTLSSVTLNQAGQYEVIAANASGSVTNAASLVVRPLPDLRITEVMPSEAANPGVPTADWWELTSFEPQAVELSGWRFNDSSGGLTDPFVLGAGILIQPGESIVFAEDLTPAEFRNWWGSTNLPTNLQIINYTGSGLSLSANGDGIRLWNAQVTDANDMVDTVDFGAANVGVSFNYDPVNGQFGGTSQLGVNGVVRAALTADIGSPGRIRKPASSLVLRSALVGGKIRIGFDAIAGYRYSLQTRSDFETATWELTGDTLQATNSTPVFFEKETTGHRRFFRVLVD